MPRRKSLIEKANLDCYVPVSLKEDVEKRLYDPRTGGPAYGAISSLVTRLLQDWVNSTPLNPITEQAMRKELDRVLDTL